MDRMPSSPSPKSVPCTTGAAQGDTLVCDAGGTGGVTCLRSPSDLPEDLSNQQEVTARLSDAFLNVPEVYKERLREIQELLGADELERQLRLLAVHTGQDIERLRLPDADAAALHPKPRYALTIKPKWCHKIFHEGKVWEIKGKACHKHLNERICVAASGTGTLVGEVTIQESRLISRQELEANIHLHRIDDLSIVRYAKIHAWVLADPQEYPEPVPYERPTGCVDWVDLAYDGVAAGSQQLGKKRRAQCQNEDCNFGTTRRAGRALPYKRWRDKTEFEHCIFCSRAAFDAALAEKHGQPIKRTLAKLAKIDAERHKKALQCIEQLRGTEMVARFTARGTSSKKASGVSWKTLLEFRKPALRLGKFARSAFGLQQGKDGSRLKKKFPSIYKEDARDEALWMSPRALAFRK